MLDKKDNITSSSRLSEGSGYVSYTDGSIVVLDNLGDIPTPEGERIEMHMIIMCVGGRMQVDMNGKPLEIHERQFLLCSKGAVLENYMASPDFACKIMYITGDTVNEFLHNDAQLLNKAVYLDKNNIITLTEEDSRRFAAYYELFHMESAVKDQPFHKELIQSLLRAVFYFLFAHLDGGTVIDKNPATPAPVKSRGNDILRAFLDLLNAEVTKYRPVEYYAQLLYITPKYLTIVCNRTSGKTASEWIREYALADIQYGLTHTDTPIKELAPRLGFENISFFGKFVRKHLGMSPTEYRYKHSIGDKSDKK